MWYRLGYTKERRRVTSHPREKQGVCDSPCGCDIPDTLCNSYLMCPIQIYEALANVLYYASHHLHVLSSDCSYPVRFAPSMWKWSCTHSKLADWLAAPQTTSCLSENTSRVRTRFTLVVTDYAGVKVILLPAVRVLVSVAMRRSWRKTFRLREPRGRPRARCGGTPDLVCSAAVAISASSSSPSMRSMSPHFHESGTGGTVTKILVFSRVRAFFVCCIISGLLSYES